MKGLLLTGIVITTAMTVTAIAGNKAPEKTSGISAQVLHQNNLGPQIKVMQAHDFRARRLTLAPGGATAEHSHAQRPGIVYVEEGEIIEYRNGVKRSFKKGDTWIETADTVHWVKNPSKDKVGVIVMIDLPVKE